MDSKIKPIIGDDGKEYYVAYCHPWTYRAYRKILNPWPEILRQARRQLASIGA